MLEVASKKSPRAPTISLKDAIERATKAYERERLHEAPVEIVAQNIGYKNANSGSALSVIASLRYFGLLTRPKNGFLAVSKELESLRFSPSEGQRQTLLLHFLTTPPLYVDLLKKYEAGLPTDTTLKYELIQRGFIPSAAETVLTAFKQSVEFANYFTMSKDAVIESVDVTEDVKEEDVDDTSGRDPGTFNPKLPPLPLASISEDKFVDEQEKIPVRLSGGRRAWLVIPANLYKADKDRLKAHIDLLLADDETY